MKIFECKCGSNEIFIKENGNNKGLYCAECGKWIKWLGKEDLRLAQRQIEQSIINPIPRNLDELKEHDKQIRAEVLKEVEFTMYHEAFKVSHEEDGLQKWDSGNWIRYKLFEKVMKQLKEKKQ